MKNHDGIVNLVGKLEETGIEPGQDGRLVPALVGVETTLMVAARGLVVGVILLDEPWHVGGVFHHTPCTLIGTTLTVLQTLLSQSFTHLVTCLFAVAVVVIAVLRYTAHVVHRRRHGSLYTRVE